MQNCIYLFLNRMKVQRLQDRTADPLQSAVKVISLDCQQLSTRVGPRSFFNVPQENGLQRTSVCQASTSQTLSLVMSTIVNQRSCRLRASAGVQQRVQRSFVALAASVCREEAAGALQPADMQLCWRRDSV